MAHPCLDYRARGVVRHVGATYVHAPGACPAQPGNNLGQFTLAVTGHTGYAVYLACAHVEIDSCEHHGAPVANSSELTHLQHRVSYRHRWPLRSLPNLAPNHLGRKLSGICFASVTREDVLTCAQDRHSVGDFHHLVELVGDEYDRLAVGGHAAEGFEKFPDFLRRENSCGFIHYQNVYTAVEHLDDLNALLLTH
ncbi:MAG: hypothetical protein BWY85_02169 [Firmicutes bacterium ADurb.Bin506]|nr:MAG: hypothetical protein BWY85_02169 [Firmicutes bacterium ADurb.Bin506]